MKRTILPIGLILPLPVLAAAVPARAAEPRVHDNARFFKTDAVKDADQVIQDVKRDFQRDVVVVTYPAIPEELKEQYRQEGKERFYANWIVREGRKLGVHGVLILITRDPPRLQVAVGNQTRQKAFTNADRDKLRDILVEAFKKKRFDDGLLRGLKFIRERMGENMKGSDIIASAGPSGVEEPRQFISGPQLRPRVRWDSDAPQ